MMKLIKIILVLVLVFTLLSCKKELDPEVAVYVQDYETVVKVNEGKQVKEYYVIVTLEKEPVETDTRLKVQVEISLLESLQRKYPTKTKLIVKESELIKNE